MRDDGSDVIAQSFSIGGRNLRLDGYDQSVRWRAVGQAALIGDIGEGAAEQREHLQDSRQRGIEVPC